MAINLDVQKLEPGQRVRLIEIDCTPFGGEVLRFHGYKVEYSQEELLQAQASDNELQPKPILWQGEEYHCWPYQITGIEMDGTGAAPTPSLSVGNVYSSISAMCLAMQDLLQAKVTIHITFQHYLDGQPEADPEQEFIQTWYIDAKTSEDNTVVTWSLSNPADVAGKMIPARQVHSICHWMLQGKYRGPDCGWTGGYYDDEGNATSDPSKDACNGLYNKGCKVRFKEKPSPFGGFLSAGLN